MILGVFQQLKTKTERSLETSADYFQTVNVQIVYSSVGEELFTILTEIM